MRAMKIIDKTGGTSKAVLLRDIPVRQVFQGTIVGWRSGFLVTGTFYKVCGPWRMPSRTGEFVSGNNRDCLVVALGESDAELFAGRVAMWVEGADVVLDYEALDAELVIKSRHKVITNVKLTLGRFVPGAITLIVLVGVAAIITLLPDEALAPVVAAVLAVYCLLMFVDDWERRAL
jgi:hypothetical protein